MNTLLDKLEEYALEPVYTVHRQKSDSSDPNSETLITVTISYIMANTRVSFEIARHSKSSATKKKIQSSWTFYAPSMSRLMTTLLVDK